MALEGLRYDLLAFRMSEASLGPELRSGQDLIDHIANDPPIPRPPTDPSDTSSARAVNEILDEYYRR